MKTEVSLPDNFSAAFMAKTLGISARRLRQLAADGVLPRTPDHKYPRTGVGFYICYRVRLVEEREEGRKGARATRDERVRRLKRENDEEGAKLVSLNEAVATIRGIVHDIRTGICTIPDMGKPLPEHVQAMLRANVLKLDKAFDMRAQRVIADLEKGKDPFVFLEEVEI